MGEKPDPTKDPKFKQVVDHFLRTPPKPHKPKKGDDGASKQAQSTKESTGKKGRSKSS